MITLFYDNYSTLGRPYGGKQKRVVARSRAHEVRAYAAHLRARQTKPPTAQAIVLNRRLLFL